MTSSRIAVCGSLVTDLVARVPRHPRPGETVLGTSFRTYLGGKGFNQALAAARLGAHVDFIGCAGNDSFGDDFAAALRNEGIGATHLTRHPEGTGVAVPIVADDGQNMIVMVPRANLRLEVAAVEAAREVIAAADVLMLQLEVPLESCVAAASVARTAHARVLWNLAPFAPLPQDALALADVLLVNEAEAGDLLGAAPTDRDDAVRAARAIVALGCPAAVVTLGSAGAAWATREHSGHLAAHNVCAVDTVGAGDAFAGAFAWAFARGDTVEDAVRWGNAAGALATTVHGAAPSMPRAADVVALMKETYE